jgi:integrase
VDGVRKPITTELIRKLPPGPVDIWDTKLSRFVVRVRKNGTASYLALLGRGSWHTIGGTDVLTPHDAREQARALLGDVAKDRTNGRDPIAERKKRNLASRSTITFEAFLEQHYGPWLIEHHKRGKETASRFRAVFAELLSEKLTDITAWRFEKWRTERLKLPKRPKPDTVNSHLTMIKAALGRAAAWKLLPAHPLKDVKPLKTDRTGRIRYLDADEERRLREALEARDTKRLARREAANVWRLERGYEPYPEDNADHLTSIVLLAINTGLRKGEIFGLQWGSVDLVRQQLTVRGSGAKSGQTRYVPLNTEAVDVLKQWAKTSDAADGYVFAGREEGESLDDVKNAWLPIVKAAKLVNFTFHDLRHTFASKLVMAGVDLNTVRELLGHADIKMTLRYAHLAPEHKAAAVAKLVRS